MFYTNVDSSFISDRLDVPFYDPEFIEVLKLISKFNIVPLENVSNKIFDPPHTAPEFMSDSQYQMIMIENITTAGINGEFRGITPNCHFNIFKNSHLQGDELLMSRVGASSGTVGVVSESQIGVNTSGNLSIIKVNNDKIDRHFLFAYFNCKIGKKIIKQQIANTARDYLTIDRIKKLQIPEVYSSFQKYVGDKVRKAEQLREEAKALNIQCEEIFNKIVNLNINLKIEDFAVDVDDYKIISSFPSIVYTSKNYEMKISPQYYHPRRVYLIEQLKKLPFATKKLTQLAKRVSTKSRVNSLQYVGPDCIDNTFGYFTPVKANISTNTVKAQEDDILFCRLRPNLNNVTICDIGNIQASAEFLQYRVNKDFKYLHYLFFVLRHPYTLYQIVDTAIGDRPRVDEELVDALLIPIIPDKEINIIDENVKKLLFNLRESERLISEAKLDVESLFEGTFDETKIQNVE